MNGSRLMAWAGASPASSATRPKLPACSTSVNALTACSIARWFKSRHRPGFDTTWPRIQSRRLRSMPAAAADPASNMSSASTSATSSPRAVAAASRRSSRLVRPDDRGPTSSDKWPRGTPPPSRASKAGMPLGATLEQSSGGSAVVSVRSSFRARSSDSRSARAREAIRFVVFRFIFAYPRTISQAESPIKRQE